MEEDGDGEDLTPFWLQSTTNPRHGDRLRRRVSSVFLSSGLVVFLLLVTAVLFLVFVVPSTLSFSAQIFKPNSVKKSWDSLNILLVLVAVLFGFLSRNKNEDRYSYYDENQSSQNKENEAQKSNPSTSNQWYNYNTIEALKSNVSTPNHQWYDFPDYQTKMEYRNPILRRNSSSYPDLREFPSTHWSYGDYQRRFLDDANVGVGRASDPGKLHRRHRSLEEVDHLTAPPETKTVIIDTLASRSTEAKNFPPSSSPPPPPPAPAPAPVPDLSPLEFRDKPKVTHGSIVHRKERSHRKVEKALESTNPISALKTTPPPPPPPNQNSSKSERKRGGSTGSSSATKDFLNSLYNKKKKKQRQKSVDNLDLLLHQAQAPLSFQLPPSSPPSTPPPSVFQNMFSSKKPKRKRTITVPVKSPPPLPSTPPPPPPPPPRRVPSPPRRNDALEQKLSSQFAPLTTHEPEKQTKTKSLEKLEEISNSGGESPLNRIPPPPPPPPAFFKKPAWKFVVQGDYVRLDSNTSSRSESPEPDEVDSDITPSAASAGNATPFHTSSLFCPSPDVNTKAESFITNFRAKLKLEKIHSMKTRELGLSALGPNPGPSQI